jgi:succinate dehydrogenase/fumarate reductase flavoprotein subunit
MNGERAHRVIVVGGGLAGLQAVRGLRRAPVEVTLHTMNTTSTSDIPAFAGDHCGRIASPRHPCDRRHG